MLDKSRETGRPMISIEGRGVQRNTIVNLSTEAGWLVSPRPVKGCLFHVAPDADSQSLASDLSRTNGVPIASYDDWRDVAVGLARVLSQEIAHRTGDTIRLQDEDEAR